LHHHGVENFEGDVIEEVINFIDEDPSDDIKILRF